MDNYDRIELLDANKNLILRNKIPNNKTFQVNMKAAHVQCFSAVKSDMIIGCNTEDMAP